MLPYKESPEAPHSIIIHISYEVHQRLPNGEFSGRPIDSGRYLGAIHLQSKDEALAESKTLVESIKQEIKSRNEAI